MIYSFSPFGYEGAIVNVEVDLRRGIPAVDIVGLADGCIAESRIRMMSAIKNQGLKFPAERVLISLSPADLTKEGSGFDLPIALAVLQAQGMADKEVSEEDSKRQILVMGELELSGSVRNVKSVNAGLQSAFASGIKYAVVPHSDNLVIPQGMKVATVGDLEEAYTALYDLTKFKENTEEEDTEFKVEFTEVNAEESLDSLKEVKGLKYAMTVAVAGKHNIVAWGRPGCGKSSVLQRIRQVLPELTAEEKSSVNRIYSIAGLSSFLKGGERPVRMPHQTSSIEGICGGGPGCRPGEISLAHNGVLFLDEATEFRSSVIQMLRVPLENKTITLSRAGRSTVFPADFQLVMAMNPCPCGNYGSRDRICLCSWESVEQYWKKVSGPLLESIGIRYNCNEDDSVFPEYTVNEMRQRIKLAWERQYSRQGKLNERLTLQEMEQYIVLTNGAKNLLEKKAERLNLTMREKNEIKKIAQTLLDMEDSPREHITEVEMSMAFNLHARTPLELP